MNLHWSGRERIAADRATVWSFINDPVAVAKCLPDVQSSSAIDAHTIQATVRVALGPVRSKLTFHIALQPREEGRLEIKMNGGGLGSAVELVADTRLTADGESATLLDWSATASLRGPVATTGGRLVDGQARSVIAKTFENVRRSLSRA